MIASILFMVAMGLMFGELYFERLRRKENDQFYRDRLEAIHKAVMTKKPADE